MVSLSNHAFNVRTAAPLCALAAALWLDPQVAAQRGRGGQPAGPPPTPKAAAPVDLSGYWVALVTDDWRWRMVTPPKGDVLYLPVNAEGRRVADAWDPAKDEAAGEQCKGYGAPSVMHLPGRLHISWQNDTTLVVETDAGTQTRVFHFGAGSTGADQRAAPPDAPSWQGYSVAQWEFDGPTRRGRMAGGGGQPRHGSLKVETRRLRPGYFRKNGVPYGANATLTLAVVRAGMLSEDTDGANIAASLVIDWTFSVSLPRLWMLKARVRRSPRNSDPKSSRLVAPWYVRRTVWRLAWQNTST